jgi:DNA-directed RNA polymerase specialized sigma24 family protein
MGDAEGEPQMRASAAAERARIQPAEGWATDDLPPDEGLDRLLGDADLLYRLQVSGYAEEEWQRPSEEFARYGFDVMVGWIFNGRIWEEVHKKTGRHQKRPDEPFDEDTVTSLAADTVVAALKAFLEKVLKANKWDPRRGASLKTYFVGQCCFQFPNVLRGHYRHLKRNREDAYADPTQHLVGAHQGPDSAVIENESARELLSAISSDAAREAFALQVIGYTEDEIAERLGVADAKAIENMLGYQRRKARQQRLEGEAG